MPKPVPHDLVERLVSAGLMCLHPDCDQFAHTRGLCKSHYNTAREMIRGGSAREDDLVARGLMLGAKARSGRRAGGTKPHCSIFLHGNKQEGRG